MHTVIGIHHYFLFSFNLSSFMVSLFSQLVNTCFDTIIQNRGVNTARGTRQCSIRPCQVSKQLLWSFPISISNWWTFMISTSNQILFIEYVSWPVLRRSWFEPTPFFLFFEDCFFLLWSNMAARPRDRWHHLYQTKFPVGSWSIS